MKRSAIIFESLEEAAVMRLPRRQFLYLSAAILGGPSRVARAQTYPARPVTLIVPYPAGGATDVVLRTLARAAEQPLGQSIVVENRSGAGGTLGPSQMAASGKSDGYTVGQIPLTVFREPFLRKTTYDPAADFTYIIGVSGYIFGVVVRSDAPWKTFRELLSDAKANPGKITFGASGANSSPNIAMSQIARQQGINWVSVPFKGIPDEVNALLGGHIHAIADTTGWGPQVNAGQFRLLVTFSAARTKNWPDAPTLKELGINIVVNSPYGIAGPRGISASVVKTLHDAFKKGMEEPSFIATMTLLDQDVLYLNSDDYRAYAIKAIAEERRNVEELGLKEE
jgi:tripartite-type tricarboxylate transporter receptor subunit TctC